MKLKYVSRKLAAYVRGKLKQTSNIWPMVQGAHRDEMGRSSVTSRKDAWCTPTTVHGIYNRFPQ